MVTFHLTLPKSGIDCERLPRAAVHARQTRSFFYALITVFMSCIEPRQPRAAVDGRFSATRPSQLKQHSTTEIPLPQDK
jgi:hypothetical protein